MYFVYFLKSINFPNQIYIGYTTDLQQGFRVHNQGGFLHAAKYKPWNLCAFLLLVISLKQ